MITKEEFNKLWAINPEGDYSSAYSVCCNILDRESLDPNDNVITIEYLTNQYEKYVESWESKWKHVEERWIPREKAKKSIQDFLALRLFMGDYKIQERPNDHYLFGNNSKEDLLEQLQRFKETWQK